MNIFRSVDETNDFLISGVDYDILSLINSSLKNKLSEIKSRIIRTHNIKNESTDANVIKQLKDEIDYLKYIQSKLESSLQKIHTALGNIK
jgi:predicted  nucleic acid-binding Zn-ribbon protein